MEICTEVSNRQAELRSGRDRRRAFAGTARARRGRSRGRVQRRTLRRNDTAARVHDRAGQAEVHSLRCRSSAVLRSLGRSARRRPRTWRAVPTGPPPPGALPRKLKRAGTAKRFACRSWTRSGHGTFLDSATEAGAGEAWDFNPHRDATNEYVRNHMDCTAAVARYRFPPLNDAFEAE